MTWAPITPDDIRAVFEYYVSLRPYEQELWKQDRSSVKPPTLTVSVREESELEQAVTVFQAHLRESNWSTTYAVYKALQDSVVRGSPAESVLIDALTAAALNVGEYLEVQELIEDWLKRPDIARKTELHIVLLGRYAKALRNRGLMFRAIATHREILALYDAQQRPIQKAATFLRLGKVYENYAQQVELSGICVDQALRELKEVEADPRSERTEWLRQYVKALDAKGQYLLKSSSHKDVQVALTLFQKAQAMLQDGDSSAAVRRTRPIAHQLQAELANGVRGPKETAKLYRDLVMKHIGEDDRARGVRNFHYARILHMAGEHNRALEHLEIAGEISRRLRDHLVYVRVCMEEASLQPELATDRLLEARQVAQKAGLLRLELDAIRKLLDHLRQNAPFHDMSEVGTAVKRSQEISKELLSRASDVYKSFREGTEYEFRHLDHREQLLELLMKNLGTIMEDFHRNFEPVAEAFERVGRHALDAAGLEMGTMVAQTHFHDLGHKLTDLEHCAKQLATLGATVSDRSLSEQLNRVARDIRGAMEFGRKLRNEASQYNLSREAVSFEELLADVQDGMIGELKGKELVKNIHPGVRLRYIWWFERVLENLLRNAVQEVPPQWDRPPILVELQLVPGQDRETPNMVELTVANLSGKAGGAARLMEALDSPGLSHRGGGGVGITLTRRVFIDALRARYTVKDVEGYTRLTFAFRPDRAGILLDNPIPSVGDSRRPESRRVSPKVKEAQYDI